MTLLSARGSCPPCRLCNPPFESRVRGCPPSRLPGDSQLAVLPRLAEDLGSVNLRFVTYNIHRVIGVDRRFRPGRIVEILRHHDPDLALLQEVDEGAPLSGRLDLGHEIATAIDSRLGISFHPPRKYHAHQLLNPPPSPAESARSTHSDDRLFRRRIHRRPGSVPSDRPMPRIALGIHILRRQKSTRHETVNRRCS